MYISIIKRNIAQFYLHFPYPLEFRASEIPGIPHTTLICTTIQDIPLIRQSFARWKALITPAPRKGVN